jgi:hypothetical protein
MGSFLGSPLLHIGVHCSRKGDDTILDRYTDFTRLIALVPTRTIRQIVDLRLTGKRSCVSSTESIHSSCKQECNS